MLLAYPRLLSLIKRSIFMLPYDSIKVQISWILKEKQESAFTSSMPGLV